MAPTGTNFLHLSTLLILSIGVLETTGCFMKPVKDRIIVNGEQASVCEYNDVKYLGGQSFVTSDCYECTCEETIGLLCCGYGKKRARTDFVGAEHCDVIENGCVQHLVRKDDHDVDCFTGLPVGDGATGDTGSALGRMLKMIYGNREDN